ncbi:MAG TPA: AMP-binding protein [Acidimicrobiales bacterium]|nr:AMP-binding protein [Acidimicrobiales bacterium]
MELLAGLVGNAGEPVSDHPTAVRVGDTAVSHAELVERAASSAARLAPGRPVAVHAAPTMDTVVAVVAGLLAGAPVVPISADVGPAERDHILRDCGARAAVGPGAWEGSGLEVVPLARTGAVLAPGRTVGADPGPARSPALIIYTSGTTGPPKGAMLSARALAADLDALAEAWAWTADDHLVHGLPLYHVHGLVLGVLGALRVGCRLTHTVRPLPEAYAAAASAGGSLFFGVPTVWSRLVASPGHARALASARLLVSGSAALPADTFGALRDLTGHEPVERYGMTETLITVSARHDRSRRPGYVGWALLGVETRIVPPDDPERGDSGEESVGELEVRGATLFDGYVGRPPSAGFSADGWFRTGDAATVDAAGLHRIVGRLSTDLIKTGGFRVGAGEVEDALLAHPAVSEAAVVGVPDVDLGQRIVAFVVCDGAGDRELQEWVAGRLSVHKRPREVRMVDALPRNALGKVQKARLLEG